MELWQLKQMQSLPLKVKIEKSKLRIKEWYEHYDGQVYVSFSGGKDSTVLLHLVRSMYPEVKAVFCDTGLEFPEIKEFVRATDNVEWLKPKMGFRQVIEKYGYPVTTKEQSHYIEMLNKNYDKHSRKFWDGIDKYGNKTGFKMSKCWRPLVGSGIKISDQCCNAMKKRPFKAFEKLTNLVPFIGYVGEESIIRDKNYLKTGCNAFEAKRPFSRPLSFWKEKDIWDYIENTPISISSIYAMGYERTGCVFCAFGCHLEKGENRFQRLKRTHPQLWNYCMKSWDKGGLGMKEVLTYIGVDYGSQIDISEIKGA